MSMFLNCSQGSFGNTGLLNDNETRGQPADWVQYPEETGTFGMMAPFADAVLWPMSRFAAGDRSAPLLPFGGDMGEMGRYAPPRNQESGAGSFLKIRGITRDSNGNPLGGCIVKCFTTVGNLFISQVTSDAGGYFEVPSGQLGVQHYLVAYQSGIPDQSGSSVNTLVPS